MTRRQCLKRPSLILEPAPCHIETDTLHRQLDRLDMAGAIAISSLELTIGAVAIEIVAVDTNECKRRQIPARFLPLVRARPLLDLTYPTVTRLFLVLTKPCKVARLSLFTSLSSIVLHRQSEG